MRFGLLGLLALLALLATACAGFRGDLIMAGGSFKHDVKGTSALDDRTSGSLLRLRAEGYAPAGFGGGAALDALASKDDLFDEGAQYRAGELFLYGGYEARSNDDFRMPVRLGLIFSGRGLDFERDPLIKEIKWSSVGLGLEVAPQVRLAGTPDGFSLWAFGDFRMGVMSTEIEIETILGAPSWDATSMLWGAHLGLRGQIQSFHFSLGYLGNLFVANQSGEKNGIVLRESSSSLSGLAFGLGLVF